MLTRERKQQIVKLDGGRCRNCGCNKSLTVHHILPRSQGGRDNTENLITLCMFCHCCVQYGTPYLTAAEYMRDILEVWLERKSYEFRWQSVLPKIRELSIKQRERRDNVRRVD